MQVHVLLRNVLQFGGEKQLSADAEALQPWRKERGEWGKGGGIWDYRGRMVLAL